MPAEYSTLDSQPSFKTCSECPERVACAQRNWADAPGALVASRSFYYVFKRLSKIDQWPQFNEDEGAYRKAVEAFEIGGESTPLFILPIVVNGSISAELALKSLLLFRTGAYPKGHNLEKLFNALADADRVPLSKAIKTKAHQNDDTLQLNLEQIANSFVDWRYYFERQSIEITGFFNQFIEIVCEYADSVIGDFADAPIETPGNSIVS